MYIYLTTSYDKQDNPDFIADFTLFILWSEIEANVAMLVCCMPTMGPVMGRLHITAAQQFRSAMPTSWTRTWTRLSHGRVNTKDSDADLQSHGMADVWLPPLPPAYSGSTWLGGSGAVIAVGYSDLERGQSETGTGILAHTEIHRTIEPKAHLYP